MKPRGGFPAFRIWPDFLAILGKFRPHISLKIAKFSRAYGAFSPCIRCQNRKIFARLRRVFALYRVSKLKIFARAFGAMVYSYCMAILRRRRENFEDLCLLWGRFPFRNEAKLVQNRKIFGRRRRPEARTQISGNLGYLMIWTLKTTG